MKDMGFNLLRKRDADRIYDGPCEFNIGEGVT